MSGSILAGEQMRLKARHLFAIEQNPSPIGQINAGNHVEQGGLARPVRPDHRDDFTRLAANPTSLTARRPPKLDAKTFDLQ